jgi:hypothetical protein
MPNILANFALNLGRQIEYSQQQEQLQSEQQARSALAQLRMQEVADAKEKSANNQRVQEMRKSLGQKILQAQSADQENVQSLQSGANALAQYAMTLEAGGDGEGAKEAMRNSTQMRNQAKTLVDTQLKDRAEKGKLLSSAAYDAQQNPSPENLKLLGEAAVAAGEDPTKIPTPGTPELKSWIDARVGKDQTVQQKIKIADDEAQRKATNERLERFHKDEERDKQLQRSQTAAHQARMDKLQEREIELKEKRLKLEVDGVIGGKKGTASTAMGSLERRNVTALVGAAEEATRQLTSIFKMSEKAGSGAFAGMHPGEAVLKALTYPTAQYLTTELQQTYETASKGLGLEIGRVATLGGGTGVTQSLVRELQTMVQVNPGQDKGLVPLYKLATGAAFIRARMGVTPDHPDPKLAKKQAEQMKVLESFPNPDDVYEAMLKRGDKGGMQKVKRLTDVAAQVQLEAAADPGATASPSPPPAPAPAAPSKPTPPVELPDKYKHLQNLFTK